MLVGASGLATLDGDLYTVLEAKGVGDGLEVLPPPTPPNKDAATAVVHGVLFRTKAANPSSWRQIALRLSPLCDKLVRTLSGDHRRSDAELESIDIRRGEDGAIRIAVGSDFGYVGTGVIEDDVATLTRCTASIRELPNNKAFEAVTLPRTASAALMAFEEKPYRVEGAGSSGGRRYRRQWLGGAQATPPPLPSELRPPPKPAACKKVPRVAGSARVGRGTVLMMSCKHVDSGYRYFLGATAPGYDDVLIAPLKNDRFGKLSPNLEGLASSGRCVDPLWMIADDHNSDGAPTVLATASVPLAFRKRLGCVKRERAR